MKKSVKLLPMKCQVGSLDDLENPEYLFEEKFDGVRALCYVNKEMTYISRNGNDMTHEYPTIQCRSAVRAKSAIFDGEIVAKNKLGIIRLGALIKGAHATFEVFDILMKNGKSLIHKPFIERKEILAQTVTNNDCIEFVPAHTDGKKFWNKMMKIHAEGVVAKERNSHYYPNLRSFVWLKIKPIQTIDCVIVGFTQTKRSVSSLALALYESNGNLHYIGKVGTGFSDKIVAILHKKLKLLVEKMPSVDCTGAELPDDIIWVKPKLVCEVKYLELTGYTILRQSALLRLRTDKKPRECTFKDQFAHFKKAYHI